MALDLTPERYRTMGFGIDLDPFEDVELASILSRAQNIAYAYCAVPMRPKPHSFLGGVVTPDAPEEHRWRLPDGDNDSSGVNRRVWPYHWPVVSVEQLRIYVTNTQFIDIPPTEVFINNTERYIEVISLLLSGYGLWGMVLPTLGLYTPVSRTAYTYGHAFDVEGEVLYPTDARLYRGLNQHWVDGSVTVYVDGVPQTGGYRVGLTEGTVLFDSSPGTGVEVAVDYTHRLPWEIRDGIAMIATRLLGESGKAARGMTGVRSIKMAEIAIVNDGESVSADNLDQIVPEAASLLYGHKFLTIR